MTDSDIQSPRDDKDIDLSVGQVFALGAALVTMGLVGMGGLALTLSKASAVTVAIADRLQSPHP